MEVILRQICFLELIGCTFNLCMLGYYTITVRYKNLKKEIYDKLNISLFSILILNANQFAYLQEWYEESMNTLITYIMILTSMMFNIFIFCFIGELVADQVK